VTVKSKFTLTQALSLEGEGALFPPPGRGRVRVGARNYREETWNIRSKTAVVVKTYRLAAR
jgi:hypothetical protein